MVQDIELDNTDTSPSMDNRMIDESQIQETDSETDISVSDRPENQRKGIGHECNKACCSPFRKSSLILIRRQQDTMRRHPPQWTKL